MKHSSQIGSEWRVDGVKEASEPGFQRLQDPVSSCCSVMTHEGVPPPCLPRFAAPIGISRVSRWSKSPTKASHEYQEEIEAYLDPPLLASVIEPDAIPRLVDPADVVAQEPVPKAYDADGAGVPQGMRIEEAPLGWDGGKVEQLECCEGEEEPHGLERAKVVSRADRDGVGAKDGGGGRAVKVGEGPEGPEKDLGEAGGDVEGHVVPVVEPPAREVRAVRGKDRPEHDLRPPTDEPAPARITVQAAGAGDGEPEAVQRRRGGGEVVGLLGPAEVAGMEDGTPDPGVDADEGIEAVEPREGGAVGRHALGATELAETLGVGPEVREGEEDGEELLGSEVALEGPLAVELDHAAELETFEFAAGSGEALEIGSGDAKRVELGSVRSWWYGREEEGEVGEGRGAFVGAVGGTGPR